MEMNSIQGKYSILMEMVHRVLLMGALMQVSNLFHDSDQFNRVRKIF